MGHHKQIHMHRSSASWSVSWSHPQIRTRVGDKHKLEMLKDRGNQTPSFRTRFTVTPSDVHNKCPITTVRQWFVASQWVCLSKPSRMAIHYAYAHCSTIDVHYHGLVRSLIVLLTQFMSCAVHCAGIVLNSYCKHSFRYLPILDNRHRPMSSVHPFHKNRESTTENGGVLT